MNTDLFSRNGSKMSMIWSLTQTQGEVFQLQHMHIYKYREKIIT